MASAESTPVPPEASVRSFSVSGQADVGIWMCPGGSEHDGDWQCAGRVTGNPCATCPSGGEDDGPTVGPEINFEVVEAVRLDDTDADHGDYFVELAVTADELDAAASAGLTGVIHRDVGRELVRILRGHGIASARVVLWTNRGGPYPLPELTDP